MRDIKDGSDFYVQRKGVKFRVVAYTDFEFEPPAFTVEVWHKGVEVDWASWQTVKAYERGDWHGLVEELISLHFQQAKEGPEGPSQ